MTTVDRFKVLFAVGTTALSLGGESLLASDTDGAPVTAKAIGNAGAKASATKGKNPTIGERPLVLPSGTPSKSEISASHRPDSISPSKEVLEAVKKFQIDRDTYLKEVQALARVGKESQTEDRSAIREQLRDNFQRLREQQTALRKEIKDRIIEMKTELSPDLGRSVANAQTEGRGR